MSAVPNEYIVRLWVDLKVTAETPKAAKEIAHKFPIELPNTENVEVYEIQVPGDVWDHR